jgi:hypothetical protein
MKGCAPPPSAANSTPLRRRMPVTVEAAGVPMPLRAMTRAILRPPQAGCAARTESAAVSTSGAQRAGLDRGRRDCSASPASPLLR